MKIYKFAVSLLLTAATVMGMFTASAAAAVPEKNITVEQYSRYDGVFKKLAGTESFTYSAKITDPDSAVKVDLWDIGKKYRLFVTGSKVTSGTKTNVIVRCKNAKKKYVKVKKFNITVTKPAKRSFADAALNPLTTKQIELNNPSVEEYSFKVQNKDGKFKAMKYSYFTGGADSFELSDEGKKVIDGSFNACIAPASYSEGDTSRYTIKGFEKGETTVRVYLKKIKVGEFKITVKDIPTELKTPEIVLMYNAHGSSTYMRGSYVILTELLQDMKAGAKYTVEPQDMEISDTINYTHYSLCGENKKTNMIYSTGKGTTTAPVFEKPKGGKKQQIGTLTIKVKKAKMSYVAERNMEFYDDGIFGGGEWVEYLDPSGNNTLSMEGTIKSCLLNNDVTGSSFKKKQYTITYTSSKPKVASVSDKGVVTAKKVGSTTVTYTITFSDGSVFSGECPVTVTNEL